MNLRISKRRLNLKIEAHFATQNPEVCQEFISCHKQELKKINVDKLGSFNTSWTDLKRCAIITARDLDNNGKMIGGLRIEPWNGNNILPAVESLSTFQGIEYSTFLKPEDKGNIAEICGLWVASKAPGLGRILSRTAFSVIHQLKIKKSLVFVSKATKKTADLMGYDCVTAIGDNGSFPYPSAEHTSYVMINQNAYDLPNAHYREKELITEVNKKRIFLRAEPKKNSRFLVQYYLNLNSEVKFVKTNRSAAKHQSI